MTGIRLRQRALHSALVGLAILLVGACGSQSEPSAPSTTTVRPTIGDLVCFDSGAGIGPHLVNTEAMIDSTMVGAENPTEAISRFIEDTVPPFEDLQGNWEIQSESSASSSEILAGNPEVGIARFRVTELDNGWFVQAVASCTY